MDQEAVEMETKEPTRVSNGNLHEGGKLLEEEEPAQTPDSNETASAGKSDTDSDEWDPNIPVPPDGGWGWMVVLSSFMIHVIADGVVYSFGIFYSEFLDYYDSGKGDTAWIASLMVGITFVSGPVASALVNRCGCRITTILGAIIATIGFVVSVWAPNIYVLYVTFGFLGGLGFGLIYLPAIVSVGQYFEKRRSFATGLAVCGSGVGTFVFAPLSQALVDYYGWKGATFILSGILLNCVILGAIFRPLQSENEKKEARKKMIAKKQRETLARHAKEKKKRDEESAKNPKPLGTPEMLKQKRRLLVEDSMTPRITITESDPQYFCSLPAIKSDSQTVKSDTELVLHPETSNGKRSVVNSDTELNAMLSKRRASQDALTHRHSHHYHHLSTSVTPYSAYAVQSQDDLTTTAFVSSHALHVMSVSTLHMPTDQEDKSKMGCQGFLRELKVACKQMSDLSLLKNPLFLMFAISNFFTSIGFNAPYIYLPDQANLLGIPHQQGAFLISVIGIANTVGRVLFGWLADRVGPQRLHMYNTALLLCGICTALSPLCVTYGWLAAYAAAYGLFVGTYVTLTAILLVDLLGLEHLVNSFGLLLLFQGAATLIGPPMLGWVFDGTGSYFISFIIAGVMIALSGAMLYFIPCVKKCQEKKGDYPQPRGMNEDTSAA